LSTAIDLSDWSHHPAGPWFEFNGSKGQGGSASFNGKVQESSTRTSSDFRGNGDLKGPILIDAGLEWNISAAEVLGRQGEGHQWARLKTP
jgi:hypothetical protein